MNSLYSVLQRCSAIILASGLIAATLSGCAVEAGGYGYGGNVGVGVDYYEPVGGVYGAWGPGYHVGPYRDGGHPWDGGVGHHAYHPAPAGRAIPSLPSHGRGR